METIEERVAQLDNRQRVSEHRIRDLEGEIKDIRTLTTAVVKTAEQVHTLKQDISEIKEDVKHLNARPLKLWDKLVGALIGAVGTGLAAALLALILKT